MWFGLTPPKDAPAAWGARAIQQREFLDLLPDRQQMKGEDPSKGILRDALNGGILKAVQDQYRRVHAQGKLLGHEAGEVTLYEDSLFRVAANTNGSHGYVYLVGYIKPQPSLDNLRASSDDEGEGLVWSGVRLPSVGEEIEVRLWVAAGPGKVLGYYEEYEHLFLVVDCPRTPEAMEQQSRENDRFMERGEPRRFRNTLVMGREWVTG